MFGYLLGWSKALAIKSIEVTAAGNEALVSPVLVPKELRIGLPIARVSTQRIRQDLSVFTWIASISVNRRWLAHDVRVVITERHPVAQYLDGKGVVEYFDGSGYNFISPNPPKGLPVIGFASENAESRSAIASFLAQTPNDLTAKMSSLSVDQKNQISLTTQLPNYKSLAVIWGSASDISLKVQVLRRLLTLPENKKVLSVDLSNPLTPVVK